MILAMNGTSGSGKSTIAKRLATELGLDRYNVGMVYRALTKYFLEKGSGPNQIEEHLDKISIKVAFVEGNQVVFICEKEYHGNELFNQQISELVALYAQNPKLRELVRKNQKDYAKTNKNVLMEGRDITSEVLKDVADIKLFVNCSYFEKTKRRTSQLEEMGEKVSGMKVLNDLYERDLADATREISRVQINKDVKIIDTTFMNEDQTVEYIKKYIGEKNV